MEHGDLKAMKAYLKDSKKFKEYLEKTKKIVLPPISKRSNAIAKYLQQVARDEVLTVPQEKFRHYTGPLKRLVNKQKLNHYLIEASGMPTGFAENELPEKEYLVDCLYSIKPDHDLFKTIDDSLAQLLPGVK